MYSKVRHINNWNILQDYLKFGCRSPNVSVKVIHLRLNLDNICPSQSFEDGGTSAAAAPWHSWFCGSASPSPAVIIMEVLEVYGPLLLLRDRSVLALLVPFWKAPSSMLPTQVCLWERPELSKEGGHCFAPWVQAEKPVLTLPGGVGITWGDLLCFRRGVTLHPSLLRGAPLRTADILNCDLKDCCLSGLWEQPAETELDWCAVFEKVIESLSLRVCCQESVKPPSASTSDSPDNTFNMWRCRTAMVSPWKLSRVSALEGSSNSAICP